MKTFEKKNQKQNSRNSAKKQSLAKKARINKAESKQVKNMLSSAVRAHDYESLKDLDF